MAVLPRYIQKMVLAVSIFQKVLVLSFWNFKLQVFKYQWNFRPHATVIWNLVKNPTVHIMISWALRISVQYPTSLSNKHPYLEPNKYYLKDLSANHKRVKVNPPIHLHLIFEILQFEIVSLINWIFFSPVWTGFLLPV